MSRLGRVLPNLRAYERVEPLPPLNSDIEIFEIGSGDVAPWLSWRCGWYWWAYASPADLSEDWEGTTLPASPYGPYKTEKRATQAASTYQRGVAR